LDAERLGARQLRPKSNRIELTVRNELRNGDGKSHMSRLLSPRFSQLHRRHTSPYRRGRAAFQGQLSDFIQKDGPAIGRLEPAYLMRNALPILAQCPLFD